MLFRNLVLFQLPDGWRIEPAELETLLGQKPLKPVGGFDLQSRGWLPVGPQKRPLLSHGHHHLLAMGINQKLLPASVVNQEAESRAEAIAAGQGYPVGRRQMRELKLKVADELRPQALVRRQVLHGWLNLADGWLAIDSSSVPRAEEFTETLRDALGSLPAVRMGTRKAPSTCMTNWLTADSVPGRFTIDQDLELRSVDGTSTVRYARHALDGRDIKAHLSGGKVPAQLGLTWQDRISFILQHDLQIRRIRFLDIYEDENAAADTPEEQYLVDFALMTGELAKVTADLVKILGGVAPAGQHQAGQN
ncbi:MAG: recombination-associated protein RdgC [Chromatiales bacterium]|nr:recombination-associated protein RdgC [Chromatiales bacterium]